MRKIYKGMQCKIYPNKKQEMIINRTFGCTRFVWNQMLAMLSERYINNPDLKMLSYNELSSLLPQLKKEYVWLKEADSTGIQNSVKTLRISFDRFFQKVGGYPKFKSKKNSIKSYSTNHPTTIKFNHNQGYLKLPKLGWVKCRSSFMHTENEKIKSVTVKLLPCGTYQATLLIEDENQTPLPRTGKQVGIDLGLTDLAITSDGNRYKSQRLHLKYKKQLYYWEKCMARRALGAKSDGIKLEDAKNYQKARKQRARVHKKIKDTRKDYLQKITTQLVEEYDFIALEDLQISNLMKNKKLSRSISNQGWYEFRAMLEYKCERYGKELVVVNPYKTSQWCSSCGFDSGKKELSVREWSCESCGEVHDRDINAAKNILRIGLEQAVVK